MLIGLLMISDLLYDGTRYNLIQLHGNGYIESGIAVFLYAMAVGVAYQIIQGLSQLRTLDDTLYLRSASINIFNGMISLTFSCDGTHYMSWEEFLQNIQVRLFLRAGLFRPQSAPRSWLPGAA